MPATGRATLVLVPTEREAALLARAGGLGRGLALEALCGFGPIAAAARAARLFERLTPARALLVGAAGSYDTARLPPGAARCFARVVQDGVVARALGFRQLDAGDGAPKREEESLALALPRGAAHAHAALLVTVGAPGEDVAARRARHPDALAEDMEGFAVALAAREALVPLAIVRGISNAVGERDRARWDLPAALAAARALALEALESREPWDAPR
jgi:futalosine hydrolase